MPLGARGRCLAYMWPPHNSSFGVLTINQTHTHGHGNADAHGNSVSFWTTFRLGFGLRVECAAAGGRVGGGWGAAVLSLLALVLGVGAALLDPGLLGPIVVGTLGLLLLVTPVLDGQ